jgi:hypothetical protein
MMIVRPAWKQEKSSMQIVDMLIVFVILIIHKFEKIRIQSRPKIVLIRSDISVFLVTVI